MSLTVNQFSIAYYEKQLEQDFSSKWGVMTDSSLDKSQSLVEQLHTIYNAKPSKSYAAFSEDKNNAFATKLNAYVGSELPFDAMSREVLTLFQAELEKYEFEETGYLLLIDYQYVAHHYFLVGVVNLSEHFTIDSEFAINRSRHLDLNKIQLAARIDLDLLRDASENSKAISFIKGRAGRQVNDFFMDLLGATETINPKKQSKALLAAIDEFMDKEALAPQEKAQAREKVYDYCVEQIAAGQDATISDLNETLSLDTDNEFLDFIGQGDFPFEQSLTLDKSTVRKLVKLSGSGGGVSISFDRVLLGDRVIYRPESDSITITGLPASLKAQLLDEFGLE